MMRTRMDFIFWKRRTEIFLQLSFKENLYENKYKAFDIYRETEMLSRRRFLRVFLLRFRFQFYSGAPNEHFSENEPLTTENENLDAFKAFSSAFLCCWKEFICSSLPAG